MKNIFIVVAFVTVGAVGYTGYNFYQSSVSVKTEETDKRTELVIVKPAIKDNFTVEVPADDAGENMINIIIKALNDGDFAKAKRKAKQAFVWTDTDEKVILEFRLNGSQWEYIGK